MSSALRGIALAVGLAMVGAPGAIGATLFQPDSATATSEHSPSFDIGNVINGSGLPANFGPNDPHNNYAINNHWTTAENEVAGVSATFFFQSEVTIGSFYMWNHRSNSIASNIYYAVTDFDLILRNADGDPLLTLPNLTALSDVAVAQTYSFQSVTGVRSVDFVINGNRGLAEGINPNFTGLAEVAFSAVGIPEPSGLVVAALALLGGLVAHRQKIGLAGCPGAKRDPGD